MEGILVVDDAELAYALRHHRHHPLATAIRDELNDCGAVIHPLYPARKNKLDMHFRIVVTSDRRDGLMKKLSTLPGVDKCVKPAA